MITSPLRIIFMGTPEFALPTLKALVDSEHEVCAVYTQPPRPAGRGQKETPSPVHQFALMHNIPVHTPLSLKEQTAQEIFSSHIADAAVVAAYGLLLPPAILEAPRMGCINVHPSLLPRWRGAAPLQRTIMAGDKETGVVIMQMAKGLDTGDMLLTQHYTIADGTNTKMLHDTLSAMAAPLVLKVLAQLQSGTAIKTPQPEVGVTYAAKITKEECHLNLNASAQSVRNSILGLSPRPGAYVIVADEIIKILDAYCVTTDSPAIASTVLDEHFTLRCAEDAICPTLVQRPGKKPMSTQELLHGLNIPAGTHVR